MRNWLSRPAKALDELIELAFNLPLTCIKLNPSSSRFNMPLPGDWWRFRILQDTKYDNLTHYQAWR